MLSPDYTVSVCLHFQLKSLGKEKMQDIIMDYLLEVLDYMAEDDDDMQGKDEEEGEERMDPDYFEEPGQQQVLTNADKGMGEEEEYTEQDSKGEEDNVNNEEEEEGEDEVGDEGRVLLLHNIYFNQQDNYSR